MASTNFISMGNKNLRFMLGDTLMHYSSESLEIIYRLEGDGDLVVEFRVDSLWLRINRSAVSVIPPLFA